MATMNPTNTHEGKALPGDGVTAKPTEPLPGEGQPARTGAEVPAYYSDPKMAMDIMFELYTSEGPKAAAVFWTEYKRLRG